MADHEIDYEDERLTQVKEEEQATLTETEELYGGMISESDQYYQAQIDAAKEWADKQQELQQANTDFAIEQIGQEKQQSRKDYLKEQSGAYTDWQKESSRYGANAEQMAASGLGNSGYSESSRVSMYNTYQNRVAAARESYNKAVLNYNNAIKDAQLQNNSALAQIAYEALQQELELSLQGFQYRNQLLLEEANKKLEIKSTYHGIYQDTLSQINTEKALAEQVRQYNESMAYQKEQDALNYELQLKQLEAEQAASSASAYQFSDGGYELVTEYYQGDLNSDVEEFGTFSNGYQPKGISGHGELSKSGATYTFNTQTLSGKKQTLTQNVWKAADDGTYWYWQGRSNKYVELVYNAKTQEFEEKSKSSSNKYASLINPFLWK